jgi:hypothetical protein
MRGGDDREIDWKGDDRDTDQKHEMGQQVSEPTMFDHQ